MPEKERALDRRRRNPLLAVSLIGPLALAGCATIHDQKTPVQRYNFDYVSAGPGSANESGAGCLRNSAFSTWDNSTQPVFSFDKESGVLTVTAKDGQSIELTGFDQTKTTLKPADDATQKIFDAYGCEVISEP